MSDPAADAAPSNMAAPSLSATSPGPHIIKAEASPPSVMPPSAPQLANRGSDSWSNRRRPSIKVKTPEKRLPPTKPRAANVRVLPWTTDHSPIPAGTAPDVPITSPTTAPTGAHPAAQVSPKPIAPRRRFSRPRTAFRNLSNAMTCSPNRRSLRDFDASRFACEHLGLNRARYSAISFREPSRLHVRPSLHRRQPRPGGTPVAPLSGGKIQVTLAHAPCGGGSLVTEPHPPRRPWVRARTCDRSGCATRPLRGPRPSSSPRRR